MKVTDLKTKELNENAMERKIYKFKTNFINVIFGSNSVFHLFLKVPFFKVSYIRGRDCTLCQILNSEDTY